jgi:hypothetical protein
VTIHTLCLYLTVNYLLHITYTDHPSHSGEIIAIFRIKKALHSSTPTTTPRQDGALKCQTHEHKPVAPLAPATKPPSTRTMGKIPQFYIPLTVNFTFTN